MVETVIWGAMANRIEYLQRNVRRKGHNFQLIESDAKNMYV